MADEAYRDRWRRDKRIKEDREAVRQHWRDNGTPSTIQRLVEDQWRIDDSGRRSFDFFQDRTTREREEQAIARGLCEAVGRGLRGSDAAKPAAPTGRSWEQLEIEFIDDQRLWVFHIEAGQKVRENHDCKTLGFYDRRGKRPNKAWGKLREFAKAGGRLEIDSANQADQDRIRELRKGLKSAFDVLGDPISRQNGSYVLGFRIGYSGGGFE